FHIFALSCSFISFCIKNNILIFSLMNNFFHFIMHNGFKVPSLRNIEKTYPYFHDGSVASLEEAVRIMSKIQNNKDISDKDVENIVAFLKSLTADIDSKYKTVANK
ncbi:c-type cytochrome, partial [Riemerella anatipestifer]|nr:c-type cytochrome [Riemerella anatipestifer]